MSDYPTEDDPRAPMAGTLAKMVGAMVMHYALLEHWIDGMVFCLFDCVEGAKEIRKHHPFNARDELDFLRESFVGLELLLPYKSEAIALLDKIDPLADFRHNVVHGHLRQIEWESGVLEFSRVVKGNARKPVRRSLTTSAENLFLKGREILALVTPAMNLTHRLVAEFDPSYKREKFAGSLGWSLASVLPVIKKVGN
jgi:hypothetical protein